MALPLAIAATVFSLIAALFAVLTFLRNTRPEPGQTGQPLADTIRTEADRTRLGGKVTGGGICLQRRVTTQIVWHKIKAKGIRRKAKEKFLQMAQRLILLR